MAAALSAACFGQEEKLVRRFLAFPGSHPLPGLRSPGRKWFACSLLAGLLWSSGALAQVHRTQNLILFTGDGIRWQEVFRGADPQLLDSMEHGMKEAPQVRQQFGGATIHDRRERLMPFLWKVVARQGAIFGNRDQGSVVRLQNRYWFSYPGYSEILTGKPQDDVVNSNDNRPNPSETVLEVLRRQLRLPREKVAVFASWETFHGIAAHVPGSVYVNAGYDPLTQPPTAWARRVSNAQFQLLTPWRSVRHDFVTFELALEHLRAARPRVLHIALGETDDWAHEDRYDRYLEMLHYLDQCLERLWTLLQSLPDYRGRTTLLITTDHGRGSDPATWQRHGQKIPEAQYVWLAAIGPDTPAIGEAHDAPELTQSDIAPTMLSLVGLKAELLGRPAGKPIRLLLEKTSRPEPQHSPVTQ